MKPRHFIISFAVFAAIVCLAATTVRPGLKISQYPNNGFINSNALFITEKGDGSTNENISFGQLALRVTNSINASLSSFATTNYVNSATNALTNTIKIFASNLVVVLGGTNTSVTKTSTNGTNFYAVSADTFGITNGLATTGFVNSAVSTVAVLWTNSGGIVMLTTNGPVSIASTGLLDGLVVTQDMRILGHNSASNSVWVCTNSTTGEGEWRTASSFAGGGGVAFDPATNILNIQYEPVRGSTWYAGTNGTPTTNQARAGLEFSPFWRSLRMGEVNGGADLAGYIGNGSNYWNNTNIGVCSVGFGSNAFVKGNYASVLGGSYNAIGTNAKFSVIGGGSDNLIITNAHTSVIAGGGKNHIRPESAAAADVGLATIGGGSNNVIRGTASAYCTIAGGGDNQITSVREATISGGFGNRIDIDGRYATIGGGINNVIGDNNASLEAQAAFVGGGSANIARGQYSVVVGGANNTQLARDNDYSFIGGGQGNNIGVAAGEFESKYAFIGGGDVNSMANDCTYGVITGGAGNSLAGGCTNGFIGGGRFNAVGANKVFATILAGERHTVSGSYSGTLGGASNTVTADRAWAIGTSVTNATAGSVTVGELISYNTPAVIAGAGSGSTNYTLQLTSPEMVLGSSNVNIVAAMGWIDGKSHKASVSITNLSANTWGFSWQQTSNRVKWQSWMYGTNAPVVLTNDTLLRIDFTTTGTNVLAEYKYFSPAL